MSIILLLSYTLIGYGVFFYWIIARMHKLSKEIQDCRDTYRDLYREYTCMRLEIRNIRSLVPKKRNVRKKQTPGKQAPQKQTPRRSSRKDEVPAATKE